jgi:hypothetical protein
VDRRCAPLTTAKDYHARHGFEREPAVFALRPGNVCGVAGRRAILEPVVARIGAPSSGVIFAGMRFSPIPDYAALQQRRLRAREAAPPIPNRQVLGPTLPASAESGRTSSLVLRSAWVLIFRPAGVCGHCWRSPGHSGRGWMGIPLPELAAQSGSNMPL